MNQKPLPFFEFIVLVAMMFAMIAFGSDAMLPAFPQIGEDLHLSGINRAQLVITIFILGTGLGQLFTGPLSDAVGRKPVILGGLLVYMAACVMAIYAQTLEALLIARFIQGVGVSGPRTVTIAMVHDTRDAVLQVQAHSDQRIGSRQQQARDKDVHHLQSPKNEGRGDPPP